MSVPHDNLYPEFFIFDRKAVFQAEHLILEHVRHTVLSKQWDFFLQLSLIPVGNLQGTHINNKPALPPHFQEGLPARQTAVVVVAGQSETGFTVAIATESVQTIQTCKCREHSQL